MERLFQHVGRDAIGREERLHPIWHAGRNGLRAGTLTALTALTSWWPRGNRVGGEPVLEDYLEGRFLQRSGALVDQLEDPVEVRLQLIQHGPPKAGDVGRMETPASDAEPL